MPTHDKGKQLKPMNEGETLYDVPLNGSSESDEDNLPIAERRLFEYVLKGKRKTIENENVSKKRKIEKVVKGREEKKDNTKKIKKRCTNDPEKESMIKGTET
ncbi:uncharacterized protein E5676_scaffold775G00810 [Cucumis melo var. makuwa]|uniref:Uncharacterized protein n=1 Tax=Cucumis melo var. makuwa TaxID=1194695 RepID=A0A5D3BPP5_CUCMM|nr:uncharacterized protein E6C27_scaffold744G00180 [Cucumis melo var. makuwa]TYK01751.1 uncharacterized protein E5676_scaffold775G00810 [Cucumis melo var. makuwa]